jgi:hypothetical protein
MPALADVVVSTAEAELTVPMTSGTWRPATSPTMVAIDGSQRSVDFLATRSSTMQIAMTDGAWRIDDIAAQDATNDGGGPPVELVVGTDLSTVEIPQDACLDLFVSATSAELDGNYAFRVDTGAPLCAPLP